MVHFFEYVYLLLEIKLSNINDIVVPLWIQCIEVIVDKDWLKNDLTSYTTLQSH